MFKKLNLFSKTEMKVLAFMSGKDGELYERQIANGTGVSAGSANAILARFHRAGLLKRAQKGKMLFYQRNDANPVLRQFKVFLTVNDLMPVLGKIAPLSRRIVLFGSCAEGRNGEKSDVDLFILSMEKEKVRRALDDYPKIQAIIMDAGEHSLLEKNDRPLYIRVEKGIEIYGGEYG